MSEQEILKILNDNSDYFQPYNIFGFAFRWLGWLIVKCIKWLVDAASDIVDDIYTLFGFVNSEQVNKFLDDFMPFVFILFGIALVFLGYRLIIHSHADQKSNIATNVVLILLVLTCTNIFFQQMTTLTQAAIKDLNATYENSSYSDTLVKENVADLVYMDSINFKFKEGATLNNIKAGNFKHLEMSDTVDPDDYDLKNSDVFENRLIVNPITGDWTLKEIKHGRFNLFPPLYYRYHVSWVTIYLTLLSLAIVLIFTIYKMGRIVFEIGFHKILGLVFAVTDIYDGRRMKEIFKSVMSLFAVVIIVNLLLKFYFLFVAYVKVQYDNDSIGSLSYGIALIIAALAVIDGPNVIERVIGIDAGIKSGYQTVIGGLAMFRGFQNFGRNLRDAAVGNPMTRSSYVDSDGSIKRNMGGIAGVLQRISRKGDSNAQTTQKTSDSAVSSGDTTTSSMYTQSDTNSDQNTQQMETNPHSNSYNSEPSIPSQGQDQPAVVASDINHQNEKGINRNEMAQIKEENPIKSSLMQNGINPGMPASDQNSPYNQTDSALTDKVRENTLSDSTQDKSNISDIVPSRDTNNNSSISEMRSGDASIQEQKSAPSVTSPSMQNKLQTSTVNRSFSTDKTRGTFDTKDTLLEKKEMERIKKESKKYE